MTRKTEPKTDEEKKIDKMKDIFETLLFNWVEACKKTGFGVSYLISISVHGSEDSSSECVNFKHGYADQLKSHLEFLGDFIKEEIIKEIGKKNFN